MSDRTQTLLVEVTDDEITALRCEEGGPGFSTAVRDHKQGVLGKLRDAALAQPEHQGDEKEAARKRWPDGFAPVSPLGQVEIGEAAEAAIADCLNEVYMQPKDSAAVWAEAALQLQARLDAQLPAPVLSDEERERVEEIATVLEVGSYKRPSDAKEAATFLRNLASQEHRGEEDDPCPSCDLGLPTGCTCAVWRGVWVWRDSITGKLQTTTGSPELSTIPPASGMREGCRFYRPESAGEVERLRERLKARRIELKELQREWEAKPGGKDRERLNGLYALRCDVLAEGMWEALGFLNAAFPPPSDSQGDQERCGTCGGNRYLNDPLYTSRTPCPDCNPAPTQMHCQICRDKQPGGCLACGANLQPGDDPDRPYKHLDSDVLAEYLKLARKEENYNLASTLEEEGWSRLKEEEDLPAPTQVEGEPFADYKRGAFAESVIESLRDRETEAKETLDRLSEKREKEGTPRSAPASPAELVAYTEKRIYRDAILTISDADLQEYVFSQPEGGDEEDWKPEIWLSRNKVNKGCFGLHLSKAQAVIEANHDDREICLYVPAKEDRR